MLPTGSTHFQTTYANAQDFKPCPQCSQLISACAGTKDAICKNCGFKDPCCD